MGERNLNNDFQIFSTRKITVDGNSVIFTTEGAGGGTLGDPANPTGNFDQYEALRLADGWRTVRRVSPSGQELVFPRMGGVAADHRYSFVQAGQFTQFEGGTLDEEGRANYVGLPDGSFQLVGIGSLGTERGAEGRWITDTGKIIFSTGGWCQSDPPGEDCPVKQLEADAPPTGTTAVYERSIDGPTEVVSLLPGNIPLAAGENASYQGTSVDGSAIAFSVGEGLFVRVNGTATEPVASGPFTFAGLSQDGTWLFYVLGGDIYRFSTASGGTQQITTGGSSQVVNVAADGSHVYYASEGNLYVWSEETGGRFIAALDPSDLSGMPSLANWTSHVVSPDIFNSDRGPGADSSRTTPDGSVLVFESHAKLTGYDNAGYTEIYLYDSETEDLRCLSCPAEEPATANARLTALNVGAVSPDLQIENVTQDGSRVFFETGEALLAADVDGINDIYQWTAGAGVSLISSGVTPTYEGAFGIVNTNDANVIFGITPNGSDLLFGTWDKLVPSAGSGGTPAIYDARVGGGFAEPPTPCASVICERLAAAPPPLGKPISSSAFSGRGNVKQRRRHCRRKSAKRTKRHRACKRQHKRRGSHGKGRGR